MLCNKNTFTFLLFSLISTLCIAQEFIYEKLGVDEGLPSSQVYDAYQSKEGYIWFATDKGISRYNGYEFDNFDTNDGLTGNVILRFYPQKNGQIWCYSFHNKSLFHFDEVFKGFKPYKYNNILAKNLSTDSIIKSVYIDAANNLHIGGSSIDGELVIDQKGVVTNNYTTEDYFHTDATSEKRIVLEEAKDVLDNSFFSRQVTLLKSTQVYLQNTLVLVSWLIG
ncbi:two-component regulator propeller domain-containing protein [Tenacibaculum tangerinum]|uniref:Two-component regulator propeller domain-containing protein n=1 Tax=Tenacibaculum tangerinum TaxID=3038772 RepID=A0ABY8LA26_9FLAO|nr:two-component regulator propeller domain-containing protein [Tenacibaculum tangerinum]WGH77008.1 two-component regulator propeller domain-containing protein [Tenacibaculum tangerinum]